MAEAAGGEKEKIPALGSFEAARLALENSAAGNKLHLLPDESLRIIDWPAAVSVEIGNGTIASALLYRGRPRSQSLQAKVEKNWLGRAQKAG